jgi:hypothetical protein
MTYSLATFWALHRERYPIMVPFLMTFPSINVCQLIASRAASGLTPSRVDMEVLRQLPLEVQQEVAAAMAHSRSFPHPRPGNLAPPPEAAPTAPPPAPPPAPDLRENSRDVWPQLKSALCQVAESMMDANGLPPYLDLNDLYCSVAGCRRGALVHSRIATSRSVGMKVWRCISTLPFQYVVDRMEGSGVGL